MELTTDDGDTLEVVGDHDLPEPPDEIRGIHDYE
jgi:hypothetical protein